MIYRYSIPIYYGTLIVYIGELEDITEKYSPCVDDLYRFDGLAYRVDGTGPNEYYVLAIRDDTTPKIIAHEAFHVVNWLFNERGIEYSNGNDEHAAYFLSWIVDKVYKSLNKYSHNKK